MGPNRRRRRRRSGRRPPTRSHALTVLLLVVITAACGSDGLTADGAAVDGPSSGGGGSEGAAPAGEVLSGDVVVHAAASLTDAFAELAGAFEAAHPEVDVVLNIAGSQALAAQILQGAPADVFASADPGLIDRVAEEGLVDGAPAMFATNGLAIAVEPGNPHGITGLADLADPALAVVLAAPEVPAGAAAARALEAAGVDVTPVSFELDVRAARSKVQLGEADAAIVYASDVRDVDGIEGVVVAPRHDEVVRFPIVALADAPNPDAARAFIDLVLDEDGQDVLERHGFGTP